MSKDDRSKLPLWRYLRCMLGSPHVADDLAQDVWVPLCAGCHGCESRTDAPWLFTIARRTVAGHLREQAAPRASHSARRPHRKGYET
ncbi:sigma-70 family RNA polymerase sigma factor [Streptomyces cupreus]|uniref:Sigma-70 family RNA polymerase sigma factor n=1 Tax=Streptomyces cupreus TaxID=2759956 RepID=A0A7X1J7Q9_9ACTN|nr:sigma-70 family RNA polymerase sigma factor [Streptomyces cupreus]